MKSKILIVIFLFCQLGVYAQFIPFAYTYGGNGINTGYDLAEADDSGYVSVGQIGSDGYTFGSSDMYVFKTDINGQLLWRKNFGGFNADGAKSIINGYGGGFLIVGYTNSFGYGGYDYYAVRIDDQGDTLWTRTYGGSDWDFANSVCATSDGNYLIAGESHSFGMGGDAWIVKINDSGDTLSTFLWEQPGDQICRSIYESTPGVCVMGGYGIFPPATDDEDSFILSWNHLTDQLVFETIRTAPGDQQIHAVDSSFTDGIVTFGSESTTEGVWAMLVQFYSSAGAFISIPLLGEPGQTKQLFCGMNFRNQGYYTAGTRAGIGAVDVEAVFYKLGTDGYFVTGAIIPGPKLNSALGILESKDRGVVMSGISEGFGPGLSGALLWKLDSMMVPGTNPVAILGIQEEFKIYKNVDVFPNPFSENITINVPEEVKITNIKVVNVEGKVIYSDKLSSLSTSENVYLGHLNSGIYFVEIQLTGGYVHRSKIIKY